VVKARPILTRRAAIVSPGELDATAAVLSGEVDALAGENAKRRAALDAENMGLGALPVVVGQSIADVPTIGAFAGAPVATYNEMKHRTVLEVGVEPKATTVVRRAYLSR
jgi:hypothetical protein